MLSSSAEEPLFAWHYMLNIWHRPDFTRSEALQIFAQESNRMNKRHSAVTLEHHFTTFLHTYLPTKGAKGEILEDNLDSPLTELNLITKVGERQSSDSGRREPIYAFRVEEKPEISGELFAYCLNDYWTKRRSNEGVLSFRDVAVAESSVGQVFKLPEAAIRHRLENLERDSGGCFSFQESSALPQVVRKRKPDSEELLNRVYQAGVATI
jgi:hypothetical protein